MIDRLIDWCSANRFLLWFGVLIMAAAGLWSLRRIPLDALPDISDVQVIVHTAMDGAAAGRHRGPGDLSDCHHNARGAARQGGSRADDAQRFLCVRGLRRRHRPLTGRAAGCSNICSS